MQTNTDITNVIVSYIGRKLNRKQYPSLKNVQSRIKGYPLTTNQIYLICREQGFRVQPLMGKKPSLAIIYR